MSKTHEYRLQEEAEGFRRREIGCETSYSPLEGLQMARTKRIHECMFSSKFCMEF